MVSAAPGVNFWITISRTVTENSKSTHHFAYGRKVMRIMNLVQGPGGIETGSYGRKLNYLEKFDPQKHIMEC